MQQTTNPSPTFSEINKELSFQFHIDCYQFKEQADSLLKSTNLRENCTYHIGYLSKINVLLYMSIECALKSLICATNTDKHPHDNYWEKVRKSGHNIAKLISHIPNIEFIVKDAQLLSDIKKIATSGVGERYCLEISAKTKIMNDFNINPQELENQITATHEILKTAIQLEQIARDFHKSTFKRDKVLHPSRVQETLKPITKST